MEKLVLSENNKGNLRNHISDAKKWIRSAQCEIISNGSLYLFVGNILSDKCKASVFLCSLGNLSCFENGKVPSTTNGTLKCNTNGLECCSSNSLQQPWWHDSVKAWNSSKIVEFMDSLLNKKLTGTEFTSNQVLLKLVSESIPVFIVGGAIRDAVISITTGISKPVHDIDIAFGCSSDEFRQFCSAQQFTVSYSGAFGLVRLGANSSGSTYMEGKSICGINGDFYKVNQSLPSTYSNDLANEAVCRDFTINSLFYDPLNKVVFDVSSNGTAIQDIVNKVLRIPVKRDMWTQWSEANPSKLLRYWKFIHSGYRPVDSTMRDFIISETKRLIGTKIDSSRVMYIINGWIAFKCFTAQQFKDLVAVDCGSDWVNNSVLKDLK